MTTTTMMLTVRILTLSSCLHRRRLVFHCQRRRNPQARAQTVKIHVLVSCNFYGKVYNVFFFICWNILDQRIMLRGHDLYLLL